MSRFHFSLLASLLCISFFAVGMVRAAVFPDVPDGHVHQEAVESLAASQIVKGNPDGTFSPDRSVNRAEMLTLLYRAKGKVPDPAYRLCFPDVEPGSWYEAVVCDASINEYVSGYADGTFKPGQNVNRVEALKMIAEVFDLDIPEITDEARDVVKFVDVSVAAWYTKYLYTAFTSGMLPIPGMGTARFHPDRPLLRGEAAAYIYNALQVGLEKEEVMEEEEEEEEEVKIMEDIVYVEFPFDVSGQFNGKKPVAFRFDIDTPVVASTLLSLNSEQPGSLTCQLYLLDAGGFSDQYFLGFPEGQTCSLLTALSSGNYQLQVQPTEPDTTFTTSSQVGTGDGNDGFQEAAPLTRDLTSGELQSGDLEDWYTFSISSDRSLEVRFSSDDSLRCIVYAMNDVDWYGFEGPECNTVKNYPPGTYYVSVGRDMAGSDVQPYSVQIIQ